MPAGLVAGAAVVAALAFATPPVAVAAFAAYVAVGIALPGMLWVRATRGGAGHIAEDLALGLAAGYAIEILVYLPARWIGLPLLVLAWPVGTLAVFALVPRLRQFWHANGEAAPAAWSWSLAVLAGFVVLAGALGFYAVHPLSGDQQPYVDMPYHLALIGELRWHVPPTVPYVAGLPLAYHWFFYAEAAATSWATGIDPLVLLYRLSVLPMVLAFVVLTASAGRRVTGRWWPGAVAAWIAVLGTVATPYAGVRGSVFDAQTLRATWISPTNALGLAMFAGLVLVILDVLAGGAPLTRRRAALIALLLVAASGAKATLLPLLLAGLVVVLVVSAVARHGLDRRAAVLAGMTVVVAAAALVLVYRGSSGGLAVGLASLQRMSISQWAAIASTHQFAVVLLWLTVLAAAVALWSFLWAGAFGLLAVRRWSATTPGLLLLAGICAAAIGAVVLFRYPGLSELYYLRAACGSFAVLAAAGIAALVPARTSRRILAGAMAVAAAVGTIVVLLVTAASKGVLRPATSASTAHVVLGIAGPIVALAVAAVIAALVAHAVSRRFAPLSGGAPLLVIALAMGYSGPPVATLLTIPPSPPGPTISGDGIAAARWLRDHSSPDDLVATNLHCLPTTARTTCDARHFWVSAFSERRILVEGWGYTREAQSAAAAAGNPDLVAVSFWDRARLEANDLAFSAPSPATVGALRSRYGVAWLFADLSKANPGGLAAAAQLRFQAGQYAVYEVPGG